MPGTRPSAARDRLLATASRMFYAEGLHTVPVDRILEAAETTRATFYRHFPGKEDLVVAYLQAADQGFRDRLEASRTDSAADTLRAVAADIAADLHRPGFRGCAFLNAAAEYPDPAHPAHRAVVAHRAWFLGAVTELLAGCLADPGPVGETFLAGVDELLRSRTARPDDVEPGGGDQERTKDG
jgi:AcrR family transcriptional regulator